MSKGYFKGYAKKAESLKDLPEYKIDKKENGKKKAKTLKDM